jgi:hypothetical protein
MFRRFFEYIDKVFGFNRRLGEITDARARPHIGTLPVLLSSFAMQVTRLGSLNALDVELHLPKKIEGIIGNVIPGVDTIGRVFTKISPDQFRAFHWGNCYRLKRNKVIDTPFPLTAIGIDGHEFFSHQKAALAGLLRTEAQNRQR